jgi:uncharacterized protein (DUF433 family)
MLIEPITHIRRDERGVTWIADTNTKVKEVVLDQITYGWDAAQIHRQHPHLSLAHIHSALAYYYDHKAEIDAQIKRELEEYERLRAQAKDQITRTELLARLERK